VEKTLSPGEIRSIIYRNAARAACPSAGWPMIVLRSPKGWGEPQEVGGHRSKVFGSPTKVRLTDVKEKTEATARILEKGTNQKPEELFDPNGKLVPELKELAPTDRRHERKPHANGGVPHEGAAFA